MTTFVFLALSFVLYVLLGRVEKLEDQVRYLRSVKAA